MSRLHMRLAKLEAGCSPGACPPIAVVQTPLPDAVQDAWGRALLADLGLSDACVAVWAVEGPGLSVLLPITAVADLTAEQEAVWLDAHGVFPHLMVLSSPEGLSYCRYESPEDFERQMNELRRLLEEPENEQA